MFSFIKKYFAKRKREKELAIPPETNKKYSDTGKKSSIKHNNLYVFKIEKNLVHYRTYVNDLTVELTMPVRDFNLRYKQIG